MADQDTQQTWLKSWKMGLAGSALAVLLLLFMFRRLFCFYTYEVPQATILTIAFGVLFGFLGNVLKSIDVKFLRSLAFLLMWLLLTLVLVMIIAPFIVQMNMNACVPDLPILIDLINREGSAVVAEDMSAIRSIYDPGAVVERVDISKYWQAYAYYSQKFVDEDHCMVEHSDYLVQSYSPEQVRLTTSSRGSYGTAGQGCVTAYTNPPGSDEWTFQKVNGQWRVVNFAFNIKK